MSSDFANPIDGLRLPPQDVPAEQAVLGGLMLASDALWRVQDMLSEHAFYRRDHRLIYRAILELAAKRKPYDIVTLGNWFDAHDLADTVGRGYLIELAGSTPSAANIVAYAEIVAEKYRLRLLIEAGTEIVNAGFDPGARNSIEVLGDSQMLLGKVLRNQPSELESPGPIIAKLIEQATETDEQPTIRGLTTGVPEVDQILGGLRGGQLIVIGGRPKMGKTTLAMNIAEHVALRLKKRVAVHSLEMQPEEMLLRSVCSIGHIDADRMRHNTLTQDEWASWSKATAVLRTAPLRFSRPRNVRAEQLVAQTQRDHAESPLGLVIIDYLQLLDLSGFGGNRNDAIGNATRLFKLMAGAMNVPVILLSQLSRKLEERSDKRPMLSDLRDSGNIEQDADAIVFVYRDEIYHKRSDDRGTAEIIVRAQRSGRPGTAKVLADLDHYNFRSIPYGWEPPLLPIESKPETREKKSGFRSEAARTHAAKGDE